MENIVEKSSGHLQRNYPHKGYVIKAEPRAVDLTQVQNAVVSFAMEMMNDTIGRALAAGRVVIVQAICENYLR